MQSERDFYLAIRELLERHQRSRRTLRDYLCALWGLAKDHRSRQSLSVAEFSGMLSGAFTASVPPVQEFLCGYDNKRPSSGFPRWQATIIRQIADLREMAEAGVFQNESRHFGIESPRGYR
jgi:hypothetical protein